ncbi:MAG: ParA family protein [Desulfobacteraceae bacterium]|nr:ParA family protein [Desulfobacteraceae bacterium]
MNSNKMRCIAVANEKGGVGKTVTVINLGAAITLENRSALIVDMDPQANATKGLGIDLPENAPSVYDLIMDSKSLKRDDVVLNTRWENLDIIPSTVDLSGAEVELVDEEGRENRLKEALVGLDLDYDFILIDTPPSLSLLTVNVFATAKEVLIPCQTHPYAFAALDELFDTIAAIREGINPDLHVSGIVATLFDKRTRVGRKVLNQLQSDMRYRDLMFNTVIRHNTTIAESADVRKPVVFFRKSSFGYIDYNDLAEELIAKTGFS